MVLAAGGERTNTSSRRALGELIDIYWFPLYAFVRRQGEPPETAEDVVQGFFTTLLEKGYLKQVDRSRGKFRSFLLAAVKHYLSKHRDKRRAQKRGGGKTILNLDAAAAETRYAMEPTDAMTPERLFERQWALSVLELVLNRLQGEYAAAGKRKLYQALEPCLTAGAAEVDYDSVSSKLGMTAGALRVASHRLRRRYRDLLREEIAQTVDSPAQIEEEIAYLLNCL
ncbi:MAG: RNA polymerase sigma factor [Phycisphaerae bacterium]